VPTVNLEYSDNGAREIKKLKGYVSRYVGENQKDEIDWEATPPETVKCLRDYGNQEWKAWDEALRQEKS
jgi:alpha-1,3-mannosyltransferase